MDRVEARCRKCGWDFSTAAKTRTTCPGCKAAVTVRRDGVSPHSTPDGEVDAMVLLLAVGVGTAAWLGWRVWKWWRGRKEEQDGQRS
jgi:hypothetical protein